MITTRIAINGLGRIGRAFLKIALERPELEIVAVNEISEARDKDQGITGDLPGEFERFEDRKKELFQCFHAPR